MSGGEWAIRISACLTSSGDALETATPARMTSTLKPAPARANPRTEFVAVPIHVSVDFC